MNEYPHEVTFQISKETEDEGGGITREWLTFASSEALMVPLSGSEYYQAQQTTNPVDYDCYIPYRADIVPSMRLLFRGKAFEITAVLPTLIDINGDYEKLNIKCSIASG